MKTISRFLLVTLVISIIQPLYAESAWEKAKNFANKHKAKIAAAAILAAAATAGVVLAASQIDKAKTIVDATKLPSDDPEYKWAVVLVGMCGPLGMEKTAGLVNTALSTQFFSEDEAYSFVTSYTAYALVKYWKQSYPTFLNLINISKTNKAKALILYADYEAGRAVQRTVEKAKLAAEKLVDFVRGK